jgi:DNA-binding MarR family transcriptional regulator
MEESMEQAEKTEFISLSEAARRLNISRVTMSKRVKAGQFTVYANPVDQREKLLDATEIEEAAHPKIIQFRREPEGKATA